jgi:tetratricopeptide (TPR) repeat protein
LLGRALALLDTGDVSRADVAWQLGAALFETGALGRAEAALDDGLRDARRLGAEVADWRIRLEQTDIQFWRIPEAASTLEIERFAIDAIANLQRLGDLGGVARAQRLLGDALGRRGNLAEAVEAYESGRRLAREVGDEREATQRSNLGVAHGPLPVDRCIEIARRNLAEARRPVPETLAGLGFLLAMTGSFDESRKAFEDAVARASQLGIEWRLASINMHFGAAMLYADDPAGAEAVLRPAVEALQEMGEQSMFSTAVALLGEALYRLGRMDDALAAADASAEATAEDDVASQMAWRGVRAKVLAAAGKLPEAEGLAREGVSYADRSDLLNMAGDAHFDLGVVLEAADRHVEAAAQFEAAAGLYSRKGNAMSIARARRASHSIHTGAGAGA